MRDMLDEQNPHAPRLGDYEDDGEVQEQAIDAIASMVVGYKGSNLYDLCGYLLTKNVEMCPKGAVFLKSIDASVASKTAETYKLFKEVVLFVGSANVVHMMIDNVANYVAFERMLEREFKTIFWSPCGHTNSLISPSLNPIFLAHLYNVVHGLFMSSHKSIIVDQNPKSSWITGRINGRTKEKDKMEDNDDEGDGDCDIETHGIKDDTIDDTMEAREVGDGEEDDTNDDVWEAEDGEKEKTERDDSNIGGYEGISDGDNNELIQVREKRKALKMQTDERKKRHGKKRKKKQAR
ncbi:hypothetical protein CRG98_009546 [Punica granatum]|uniref:DUF659 domain-containing protein n=1 Tax=Punica granatum TaxID=22663 RepID=A0A2I0KP77_PUNGR|nr:hypothetical protein CRG98_009546 [Punica granatum]